MLISVYAPIWAAIVARMSETACGVCPGYRFAHPGYEATSF